MKKMKKINLLFATASVLLLSACSKEYSLENDSGSLGNIVGADCRIRKIGYSDSASGTGIGSVTATINATDRVTDITDYDSLTSTLNFYTSPVYINDTVYIDPDEYFVLNSTTKLVKRLHALLDPTDPFSPQIEIDYNYDGAGYLLQKQYTFSALPGIPYEQVDYTYASGNLVHMQHTNLISGDKVTDADITYSNLIAPKNYIYIFPDELTYGRFTQFFNFGKKPFNAVTSVTVNNYDPGNVLAHTSVSTFKKYILSVDQYVLSCIMKGDDLPSLPAVQGVLSFSYHCN